MPQKIFEIDLDIKNPEYKLVPYIEVVSGDTDANIFNIQLFENFVPLNASGNTAVIIFEKPDKTSVFQNLTIIDATKGKYTCTLSSQTILVPGRIKAEVALYEGTKKITSTKFEFAVRKSLLNENTVESSNEFTALTEALGTVNQYDSRITTVEQDQAAHEADLVTDTDGAHGLKIEEGTFTPYLYGSITPGENTYTQETYGSYIKHNNKYFIICCIRLSAKDGAMAGDIRIGGLPAASKAGFYGGLSLGRIQAITYNLDELQLFARLDPSVSDIKLYMAKSGVAAVAVQPAAIGSSMWLYISGSYLSD